MRLAAAGALGGLEREAVGAVQVYGLAHAAGALQEGDLAAVGGAGIACGEVAAVAAHAGRCGELPGRAAGRVLESVRRQRRCLEAVVADQVPLGHRHQVDQGGVVSAQRVQADERDRVRPGRQREIRRLVQAVWGAGGGDQAHLGAVDQHFDLLIMRVAAAAALGNLAREAVGARAHGYALAHAAGALQEGDLSTVGGVGIAGGQGTAVAAHPGRCGELPRRAAGRVLEGVRGQLRHLETAVADGAERAAAGQAGGDARRQQLAAFEAFEIQPPRSRTTPCLSTSFRAESTRQFLADRPQHRCFSRQEASRSVHRRQRRRWFRPASSRR